MPRIIAIGDIHGCAGALEDLLQRIQPTPDDTVIALGDYVDRGPDSRRVIEALLRLSAETRLVALLGNHELMMLGARSNPDMSDFWEMCGGQETLDSYGGSLANVPRSHWDFLDACLPHYETDSHFFVHANYLPHLTLEELDEHTRFWTHLGHPLPAPHRSGKVAVVGHTPQVSGRPLVTPHLIALDTYCFGGGHLTGYNVATGEYWQACQEVDDDELNEL